MDRHQNCELFVLFIQNYIKYRHKEPTEKRKQRARKKRKEGERVREKKFNKQSERRALQT